LYLKKELTNATFPPPTVSRANFTSQMEARFESPVTFRKILDALRELVEEVNIDCNESGLSLQAMDASHVALVSMQLDSSHGFDRFSCSSNLTLGVNLASIQKILKCGESSDTLTLRTNPENSELKFEFENAGRFFEFSMALMDIDSEHMAIPDSEPDAKVTLASSEFQKVCKDMTQFGDRVKISVTSKSVSFSVSGSAGNGTITLAHFSSTKGEKQVEITCSNKVELTFALKYLVSFAKAAPLSDMLTLEISEERPLVALFQFADEAGFLKYYLAPKVDDDDEGQDK
jgi:proliferating cell nuclear antigen